ncbi:ribonuclease P protein subunit p29 [Telopea speciosissima]|uniref:ribonuclease P protein subunit p29 n=1 Tax=Telopea speciosissima TaxID=54955 RepID=UPI001CC55CD7|nr:ribonuclease P protein subunit p29 [Telopea speciosissima]
MATDGNSVISDQKRRTLEALERRFAVSKAELIQKQQKDKKKWSREDVEVRHDVSCSTVTPLARETDASVAPGPSSVPSSHKVHFLFAGHTPSRGTPGVSDVEANGPAYSQLSQPVHENLLSSNIKRSSKRGSQVDRIMHELLQNGDKAQKYMQGSRSMKIDNWLLLDNLVQGRGVSAGARIRTVQNCSKRSKKHMSIRQHKKCKTFDLPQEFHNFDTFKPMHDMWKDYIMQLLKDTGEKQLAQCLLTADLHGAILLVADCKIIAFNGVSGIMIRETAETFGIITQDNKFRVVPKRASVFIFQADCWRVTLQGDKFASRDLGL